MPANVFPFDPRNRPPIPPGALGIPDAPDAAPAVDGSVAIDIKEDGSVSLTISDEPIVEDAPGPSSDDFSANLAEDERFAGKLFAIATDLLEGIEADDRSRSDWVQNYTKGLDLLGLKLDAERTTSVSGAFTANVQHSLLLEACLKFQARARGEMLPASGPAKIRNDGDDSQERDALAEDLEEDYNHWLTVTATEYYPDTDRALFLAAFGGCIHKKVYRCPVRNRPVSESVELPDLIISNDATDIANAARVTHRIVMSRSQMEDMRQAGAYRDIPLDTPVANPSTIDRKEAEIKGIAASPARQADTPYTIYECYTRLKLEDGETARPYKVSLDKDSRQVLEVRRNWREDDEQHRPRRVFVKWPFIPGPGYLDLGYVHILGQHAKAMTAIERILIDAGMFANFPGGVKLKGGRSTPNEIRPDPGTFVDVDGGTAADDIRKVIMGLPYNGPSAELMALWGKIEDNARNLAGAVEMETGEGRSNVPVGTVMAMIEQQTQLMTGVHKRMHQAQQEEFLALRDLFLEDPESLTRDNPQAKRRWTVEALADMSFVPASDPNVPAQTHRIMQAYALSLLAKENPDLYDQRAVQIRLLSTLNISDVDSLLVPPQNADTPDPTAEAAKELLAIEARKAEAKEREVALAAREIDVKVAQIAAKREDDARNDATERVRIATEAQEKAADRRSREGIEAMKAETGLIEAGLAHLGQMASPDPVHDDRMGP